MFRAMFKYKLEWLGGKLLLVSPENTSRQCSCCGHIAIENRQTQSKFQCTTCGYSDNADLNAAENILRAGLARLACGELPLGNSVKQLSRDRLELGISFL